jgi:hypothetical protein
MQSDEERLEQWRQADRLAGRAAREFVGGTLAIMVTILALLAGAVVVGLVGMALVQAVLR